MSGINGINWPDRTLISKMNDSIKHRGLDGDGIYVDDSVSLGHRRSSIIDISQKGNQPMANEDKSIWITYDGIIYNFPTLKKELINNEKTFESKTDTEVILRLYEEKGTKSFLSYNGMFAFCIYDKNKKCLYLVRDRLGSKPVFYSYKDDKFIFSSEIKTFNIFTDALYSLDYNAILEYFLTRNISTESFFKDVKAIEPGSFVKYDLTNQSISKEKYFDIFNVLSPNIYRDNIEKKEKKLIEELDLMLNKVVRDQLISDVKVGTICSGGVDSSLLTAIAKKYTDDLKIFYVKIDDEYLDESTYSKRVADHLGLELIEELLDRKKFKELYEKCIVLADLPLIHPISVGIHYINKKAKEHGIDVILGGEGADEIFGGYLHYKYLYRRLFVTKTPILNFLNKKLSTILYFKDFTSYMLEDENYIVNYYKHLPWNRDRYNNYKTFYEALNFLNDNFEQEMAAYILKDLKYYLPPTLWEADRMAMGAGVEMRAPFLDNRLVDFAINLPLKYKVGFFKTKYLLKKVAERYLPKDIVYRKKMGFGIPNEKWLNKEKLSFKEIMYSDWEKIYG